MRRAIAFVLYVVMIAAGAWLTYTGWSTVPGALFSWRVFFSGFRLVSFVDRLSVTRSQNLKKRLGCPSFISSEQRCAADSLRQECRASLLLTHPRQPFLCQTATST